MKTGQELIEALGDVVRVACYDFKIERWKQREAAAARRYGECCSHTLTIRIAADIEQRFKIADTLLHEISHAIYWAYNIQDGDVEERICGTLGAAWTQVYRDNPWLLWWLVDATGEDRVR